MIKIILKTTLAAMAFTICCLLAACSSPDAPAPRKPEPSNPMQALDQGIESKRQELKIPGMSVAVLKKHQIIFKKGFGYADIENRVKAAANTPYNIASLTKPFGATILMGLVEEGLLDLDDSMSEILEDTYLQPGRFKAQGYAEACRQLRELSRPNQPILWDYRCDTEKISVRHHLTHTSQGSPGEKYYYNGFLFKFLANVAEETSGKAYEKLLVEKIIAPLEMTSTYPSINQERYNTIMKHRAKYYRVGACGEFIPSHYPVRLSTSAGMVSTVADLAKFDIAMDRDLIISKESKEAMHTPAISSKGQVLPYGYGWFIQNYANTKIIWHYGYAPKAYSSLIVKIPEKELTFILLANSDGASKGFRLGRGNVLNSPFALIFFKLAEDLAGGGRG